MTDIVSLNDYRQNELDNEQTAMELSVKAPSEQLEQFDSFFEVFSGTHNRVKVALGLQMTRQRGVEVTSGNVLTSSDKKRRSEYMLAADWYLADPEKAELLLTDLKWYRVVQTARTWKRENTPALQRVEIPVSDPSDRSVGDTTLLFGDFRDRLEELPDNSVDLIVTDPPYPAEFLPLWSDLAEHAARLLGPRGILFAWSGKIQLPEVMNRLSEHLTYGWMFKLDLPGSNTRIMGRHVRQTWKPVLAYTTGTWPSNEWGEDALLSPKRSKADYEWEQHPDPAVELIERYSPPGGLVVDPFLGVGTFGVAATSVQRRFVGVELDVGRFSTSVEKIIE